MLAYLLMPVVLLLPAAEPAENSVPSGNGETHVSWEEVRGAVEESFCMKDYELPDKTKIWQPLGGFRELCGGRAPGTRAGEAAERAVEQIRPVLVGLKIDGLYAAYDEKLSPEENTKRVRDIHFGSSEFMDLLLPHLYAELDQAGFVCDGCPARPRKTPRHVRWEELAPYVAAHAWPDPVVTTPPTEDDPNGRTEYGLHFCAGLNGISEMEDPDPQLTRAGFVAMFHTRKAHEVVIERFKALRQGDEFEALVDDAARTEYLRRRLGQELIADPEIKDAVCPTLDEYASDLNLAVEGCGTKE